MRRVIAVLGMLVAVLIPGSSRAGATWGVAAGVPQTIALTVENNPDSPVRFQAHAGTILVMSSVAIRAILLSPDSPGSARSGCCSA